MNRVHVTKDGSRLFISEMDDTHLQSMIKLMLRGVNKIKKQLRCEVVEDKFRTAMYGEKDMVDMDQLNEMLENLTDKLYPYLAEIALRGIDMSTELQATFEREGMNLIRKDDDEDFQILLDQM